MWDYMGEPSLEIKLHTKPLHADWVDLDDKRERSAPIGKISVMSPPGSYAVKSTISSHEFSHSFELVKDPNSEGSLEDINAQVSMLNELREDMNKVGAIINKVEDVRREIMDIEVMLSSDEKKLIKDEMIALKEKLDGYEGKLFQTKQTGKGQDAVRWPVRLAERIYYLASTVSTSDFPPADSHLEVHQILKGRIDQYQSELDTIMTTDVVNFANLLREHKIGPLNYRVSARP
jgi:hypothetical protein